MRTIFILSALVCTNSLLAQELPERSDVSQLLTRLPLSFERNTGQASPSAAWVGRGNSYRVELDAAGATIAPSAPGRSGAVRIEFLNARPDTKATPSAPLPGKTNYLLGSDSARWIHNLSTYSRIEFGNVYTGIDVAWHGAQQQIEYDFVVRPRADANRIRMRIGGARKLAIASDGALDLDTSFGPMKLQAPRIYQDVAGVRRPVAGSYVLEAGNTLRFQLAPYDKTRPLVIDPTLLYGSFFPGFNISSVATDSLGNIYLGGTANAGMVTVNPLQATDREPNGAGFAMKLNPAGSAVLYSTYIGGSSYNSYSQINGIAVDAIGELGGIGSTSASDFPLSNAAWSTFDAVNNQSAAAVKLSADGSSFIYSTYLSGVFAYSVVMDGPGNAYICGDAYAIAVATPGAYQSVYGGGENDGFVAKLGPAGALSYFTLLGGPGYDQISGIAIDAGGNAYVAGFTDTVSFAKNPPGAQTTNAGGYDAFVAEISADGTSVPWLTFLGGSGDETLTRIARDATTGILYISGATTSANLPTTAGVVQPSANGPGQGFLASVNPDGMSFGFVTYLGGQKFDTISALTLTPTGQLAVAGYSTSSGFATSNAIQPAFAGNGVSLFSSANSGASWTPDDSGLTAEVSALANDPSNAGTLLALSIYGPFSVFRTTNGGASWTASRLDAPRWYNIYPPQFARSPANSSVVYAYLPFAGGPPPNDFVYRSTDDGVTWTRLVNPPISSSDFLQGVALSAASSGTFIEIYSSGAVYRSTDGGTTFTALPTLPPIQRAWDGAVTGSPDGSIYLGTYSGIDKSTDGGATWSFLGATGAFANPYIVNIVVSPSSPSVLYAIDYGGGIHTSSSAGNTWSAAASPSGGAITSLAVAPSNASVLYALNNSGVFMSTDGAISWTPAASLPFTPRAIAVNLSAPATVYAGGISLTEGFVAKFNLTGTSVLWSTFYTGSNGSAPAAIASLASGDVWIAGNVPSADLPLTSNGYSSFFNSSGTNGFLARISDTTAACSYSLNPSSLTSYGAQALTFAVTAPSGCAWTATPSDNSWITVTNGSGTASAAVSVTLAANHTGATRTGSVSVNSQTFSITQADASCSYSATTPATVPDTGGTVTIDITAPAGCPWDVVTESTGVTVTSGGSGTGNGTVTLSVSPNPSTSTVSTTVAVGNKNITISEADICIFAVSAVPPLFLAPGGTESVSIAAPAGCAWTATSSQSWLSITAGSAGAGNGTVTYKASANTGKLLTTTLTIAGQTFQVSQTGAYLIETIGGGQLPATSTLGVNAGIVAPQKVAADLQGNIYFSSGNAVYRQDGSGVLTRFAGTGAAGYSGDGGPALSAQFNGPAGVAVDGSGNVYIADDANSRIRKVDGTGTVTLVAGTGGNSACGYTGDGAPATAAQLCGPTGLALDPSGNLYFSDIGNNVVREISVGGDITTVAGNGQSGYAGDNGPATSAEFNLIFGLTVDASGNLYIADTFNQRVREVSNGVITTVAGNGNYEPFPAQPDNIPATQAAVAQPWDVAVDAAGNLYIADTNASTIRMVSNGLISTVAGTYFSAGYSGDNGPALGAQIADPNGLAFGPGGLYIADTSNNRIRQVDAAGTIATVAGGAIGDDGPAPFANLFQPNSIAVDGAGNTYFTDSHGSRVRKIAPGGAITTVAGTGISGFSGDNGPATSAEISSPSGVVVDSSGNLYFIESTKSRVREIARNGDITTVAGTGTLGYSGDNGPATAAKLEGPSGLAVDSSGNLYIADTGNCRVRMVASSSGAITTVAGNGTCSYGGDNGAATSAELSRPTSVTVDSSGNLYIVDAGNYRIRTVANNGVITTVAGTGTNGYSGDNGPATSAEIYYPTSIAVDSSGNLYLNDNGRIRVVTQSGTITTIAGNGAYPETGDDVPALSAAIGPSGLAVDPSGNVYFADALDTIRMLIPEGGPPLLSVVSTHSGSFIPGSIGEYTLRVSNAALAGATNGTVTVTEIAPPGITITGMIGNNWSCGTNTCMRSDSLASGHSYDTITVSVNVAAPAPIQATNQATVFGGGAFMTGAEDLTVIGGAVPAQPALAGPSATTPQDSLSATLSWSSGVGATAGVTSYNVYFGTTSPPPLVGSTTSTSYTVTGLHPGATYYWQVQANNGEHTASSAVQSFGTVAASAACQVTQDAQTGIVDVQRLVNEGLGAAKFMHDLTGDGAVTVADIQIVANAAAGKGCTLM